jgi:hypothetical protein
VQDPPRGLQLAGEGVAAGDVAGGDQVGHVGGDLLAQVDHRLPTGPGGRGRHPVG